MSPVFYGTGLSISVTPASEPVTVVIPCTFEWLLDGPWEVVGRVVVNRELRIVVYPTRDLLTKHDPYHLCEALNRIYLGLPAPTLAPVPPPDDEPPSQSSPR